MRHLLFLLSFCTSALAGELIHEDFSGPDLPKGWTTGGRPHSWTIVDGTLQGTCAPDDGHGPAVFAALQGHNLTLSYKVKLDDKGNCLMLVDGESAFGGSAHLLRVAISEKAINIAQDRGTPQSHVEQGAAVAAARKEGKTLPPPTPAQLADPKFYRTERLATAPLQTKPGEWLTVAVTIQGNDVVVSVNGGKEIKATGTVMDTPKSRLVFLVGASKRVWIDDVHVSDL